MVFGVVVLSCKVTTARTAPWAPRAPRGRKAIRADRAKRARRSETGPQGERSEGAIPASKVRREPGGAGTVPEGTLNVSCLSPCHSFSGIVRRWKTSRHYATYIANLGGDEVESWTGPKACGNCHASDGVEQRLAGNVTPPGDAGPVALGQGQLGRGLEAARSKRSATPGKRPSPSSAARRATATSPSDPHLTGVNYAGLVPAAGADG